MRGGIGPTVLLEKGNYSLIRLLSFTSQGVDGVGEGGPGCSQPQHGQCDEEQQSAAGYEEPPAQGGFISEILQPFITSPPGDRHGDDDGQAYQFYEVETGGARSE